MRGKRFTMACLGIAAIAALPASAVEIYSGEPLGEALHDLAGVATLIAHPLSSASPLLRTDVFRLADGRLVAVSSRAGKLGEPFSIEGLRVTPSAKSQLTRRLPTVSAIQLSR
jgi:hypothetical protein